MSDISYDVIIAGTGPAGMTAAIYAQRMGLRSVVYGDLPGGSTYMIEHLSNFPGLLPETSGPQFGTLTFQQASQEGATFTMCLLESLRRADDAFLGVDVNGQRVTAPVAIAASGRTPRRLEVENVQIGGVHLCSICDGPLYRGKDAILAVVGGGNAAAQHALTLSHIAKHVYIICRSENPGIDAAHRRKLAEKLNVTVMLDSEVVALKGQSMIEALVVKQSGLGSKEIQVEGVFQAIGWDPNTAFLDVTVDKTAEGYLKTDGRLMTSVSGLFAAGDVRDTDIWQVLTACADGARAAKSAGDYLAGQ
jgi:thioredoxin reductase (NADPH)